MCYCKNSNRLWSNHDESGKNMNAADEKQIALKEDIDVQGNPEILESLR